MRKKTQIYAIGVYDRIDKHDISVFRYDPRIEDGDVMKTYRHYSPASKARVMRYIADGKQKENKIGWRWLVKYFSPSPRER